MKSPKETYIEMVEALRNTRGYNEFKNTEKKYWSQDMIKINNELASPDIKLSDEEMAPTFRFDIATLPTSKMLEDMTEEVSENTCRLTISESVKQKIYMVKEGDEWKYDSANLMQEMGTEGFDNLK